MKRIRLLSVFLAVVLSGLVLPEVHAAEAPSWSSVYESFVFDKTFLSNTDPAFYTEEPELIRFGLYDMDLDGIPELIAYDGCGYMAGATNYVFTCRDGELAYLGDAGFRGSYLYYFRTADYPGLFCTDGNMGYIETFYYDIQNGAVAAENVMEEDTNQVITIGKPQINKVTERDDLFILVITETPVPLDMFTLDEIRSMGWQSFLSHSASSTDTVPQNTDTGSAASAAPSTGSAPAVSSGSSQAAQAAAPSAYSSPFYGIWCSASKSLADEQAVADVLVQHGYSAQVLVTTDWDNLNPEMWYVATAGLYPSEEAANADLASVRTLYPDAYVKYSGSRRTNTASAAAPSSAYMAPFYGIWCSASKSQADEQAEAGKLTARGLPAQIFVTTDWDNLNPEFWYVLSAGTYASEAAACSALPQIQAVFPDAYVKYSGNYIGG